MSGQFFYRHELAFAYMHSDVSEDIYNVYEGTGIH